MATVSASEYSKKVGLYHTLAQREPVIITSHGRAETVLISAEEYRRLTGHHGLDGSGRSMPQAWKGEATAAEELQAP